MELEPAAPEVKSSSSRKYVLVILVIVGLFVASALVGYFFRGFSPKQLLKKEKEVEAVKFEIGDYKKSFIRRGVGCNGSKCDFILGAVENIEPPKFIVNVEGKQIDCITDDNTRFHSLVLSGESKDERKEVTFSDLKEGDQVGVFCYEMNNEICSSIAGITIFKE